jgi:hypothetical protein
MRKLAALLFAALIVGLAIPAGTLAAPATPTIQADLRGDCAGLTASLRWDGQKHARSYRLDVLQDGVRTAQLTGSAGRVGTITQAYTPRPAAEAHVFEVQAVLLDRSGTVVATARPSGSITGSCVLPAS